MPHDIPTVVINIDTKTKLSNTSDETRTTSEKETLPKLQGFEENIRKIIPKGFSKATPIDITGAAQNKGSGSIDFNEQIEVKVAVVVT